MKVACISDTHGFHHEMMEIADADILIHAGDLSARGTIAEIEEFLKWFSELKHEHKIFISGNHDFFFDSRWKATTEIGERRHRHKRYSDVEIISLLSKYPTITYLNDTGCEINGLKIWGSPVQPWFHDWAFNRQRGFDINYHWKLIPNDTNILITHGPIKNILDKTSQGLNVGCEMLAERVKELKDLKLHLCGHIHESAGYMNINGVYYVNASICDLNYIPNREPLIFNL